MRELLVRTATGITLVVLFVGSILAGPHTMLLMMLLIYGQGARELLRAANKAMGPPVLMALISGAIIILLSYFVLLDSLDPLWLLLPLLIWLTALIMGRNRETILLPAWLGIPLSAFLFLGYFPEESFSPLFPTSVIAMVWISDTFSYLTGRLFGRHALTPVLSPGKTWEGFLGGLLLTSLSGWVFYLLTDTYSVLTWIISGFLVSLLGVAGDLFESQLKRRYGIKDMGNILPGHGGILDRFDSLFLVAPAVFLFLYVQHLLQ